jgi:hypothetical protein
MKLTTPVIRSAALILALAAGASSDAARIMRQPGGGGQVNLPYSCSDGHGATWWISQPWTVNMQGQWPIYAQAGAVSINGINPNGNNSARIDDKTGELIMENLPVGPLVFTRRIKFNADEGWIRIVDIVKNPTTQEQPLNLQATTSVNYGVQSAQLVSNPKKPSQNLGWVAQIAIGGMAKLACDDYAGPGGKVMPTLDYQQGNNNITASLTTNVPAGKQVAFVHFHMIVSSQDQGTNWINSLKESKIFSDLPRDVRHAIVNFRAGGGGFENIDVLRGDSMDVVELKSGDKFNGTLTDTTFKLNSLYGPIDLPGDKIVGIVNTGQFRMRQLVVTADGQVIGGQLEKQTVDLQLSTGQKVTIPMTQISRVGYRHRSTEPEDGADDTGLAAPYVMTEDGDRVGVVLPTANIAVATRYGGLDIPPADIGSISFNSDDSGAHLITLTDGSHFTGLLTASDLEMKLSTIAPDKTVKFPVLSLNKIVFKAPAEDKPDAAPVTTATPVPATLVLKRDDTLNCNLTGNLKLDTAFDTISLDASELKSVVRSKDSPTDVNVTTWDGTVFSGQLQDVPLVCHTTAGVDLTIPTAMVESYTNPVAKVPAAMIDRIKTVAKDLNADGWKDRDAAQAALVKMGPAIIPTLQELRNDAPPEAQQRIDTIIKQLSKP